MLGGSRVLYAQKNGYNIKKKTFAYSERSEGKRQEYLSALSKIPESETVYVDETGVNQHLQREKGRSLRGRKVFGTKPGRKYKRVNIIGGMSGGRHIATRQYGHPTNSVFFEDWFENDLLPLVPKGHTIIMDNASFHRKARLYELSGKAGVKLLFLPPYSPDFNPIEKGWANMKKWLRDKIDYWGCLVLAINEYFWWNDYYFCC